MSIRSIQQMERGRPWGSRVFDCNYRGDYVSQVKKKTRGSRRKAVSDAPPSGVDLLELTELKVSVCKGFVMRLEADKVDVTFYQDQSIKRNIPLTTGIGSCEIDRNSIDDLDQAKIDLTDAAKSYVNSIKTVCETIDLPTNNFVNEPWPSHVYFEDVNGETQFELVELILNEAYKDPSFKRRVSTHEGLPETNDEQAGL
jgi:hypothetical protein